MKTRGQESLGLGVGLEVGDQAGHLIQPLGAAVQGADEGLEDLSLAPRRQPSVSLRVPPTLEERLDPLLGTVGQEEQQEPEDLARVFRLV